MASASAAPPPGPTAKPEEPPKTAPSQKVALTLEPGKPPCTLVLDGERFEDHPEWFTITNVTRMATEESGGCAAGVFYDLSKDIKPDTSWLDSQPLAAGAFQKTEKPLPAEAEGGPGSNRTEDLNFDGVNDLCVVQARGAYGYSQKCYLFDTKSRTFVHYPDLDDVVSMMIDRQKKKITNSYRVGGPVYENNEYVWQKGKLVKTFRETSYLFEKPDGTPLNPPFHHWLTKYELRNGKLVKTFDGAIREKP